MTGSKVRVLVPAKSSMWRDNSSKEVLKVLNITETCTLLLERKSCFPFFHASKGFLKLDGISQCTIVSEKQKTNKTLVSARKLG